MLGETDSEPETIGEGDKKVEGKTDVVGLVETVAIDVVDEEGSGEVAKVEVGVIVDSISVLADGLDDNDIEASIVASDDGVTDEDGSDVTDTVGEKDIFGGLDANDIEGVAEGDTSGLCEASRVSELVGDCDGVPAIDIDTDSEGVCETDAKGGAESEAEILGETETTADGVIVVVHLQR